MKKRYFGGLINTLDEKTMLGESEKALDSLEIHFPNLTQPIESLSGGQRQAVAIARAVYWDAKLMIMDEPTNNLGVPEQHKVLEVIGKLRNQGVPVILMTGHGDIPMSVRAMKAGAVDFLPKPFRDQDMIDAVSTAIERDRRRRAAESDIAQVRERFATLSPREQQVMTLVTAGKMNKQVAFDLGLSEITVKTYRGAVMDKMAARSFADLVRMADALRQPAA